MSPLADLVVSLDMAWRRAWSWRAFLQKTREPERVQEQVLQSILRRNRQTRFGREHGFASIRSAAEYAARIPIRDYDGLRPYIERQQQGEPNQLTTEAPVLFAQTSGTTGTPKYLPILPRTLAQAKRDQRLYSCAHYSAVPGIFSGKTLAFVGAAVEGVLPSGVPFGSMSGLIYRSMPRLVRSKYVVPTPVFECRDYELKYFLVAAFAVAERGISHVAAANPSTFLKLDELIRTHSAALVEAVESGRLPSLARLDPSAAQTIEKSFKADPKRAAELRRVLHGQPRPLFSALWPELVAVSCWREGSCRLLLPAVQRLVAPNIPVLELGYLASEARGSLPVDSLNHREVPSLHANYFEFIERSDWEAGQRHVRSIAELEIGRAYHVILTTPAGLYRYFMNDVIVVDGRYQRTPTIKFLEKGAGVTNITGEKLHESQVTEAVEAALAGTDEAVRFFLMIADEAQQGYTLYLEAQHVARNGLAERIDAELAARNIEYDAKRSSGRLRPLQLAMLRSGTSEVYKTHLLAQGQREAQFKFLRLQTRARLSFDLDAHVAADAR